MSGNKKSELVFSDIDLESILECAPGYIYWKNLNSVYLGCNQNFEALIAPKKIADIIGLSDYEMPWGLIKPETAAHNVKADQYVINTGKVIVTEENVGLKKSDGRSIIMRSEKRPLRNKKGDIIGVLGISVDITDQKEAERSRQQAEQLRHDHEIKMQQLIIEEKEKRLTLAHKVAHDICSPLSALMMMMPFCDELQERKRSVIKSAAESISDIANNLLSTYQNERQSVTLNTEQRQPVLISDAVIQLLSEKKAQYHHHTVRFETNIASDAQFACAQLQPSQFRRCMSNLINNAVDALNNQRHALITIKLTANAEKITVAIHDNGKGMPANVVEKIMRRTSFTEGKQQGHGLGLQQVWDTMDENQGVMTILSIPDKGTTIQLTFPRIPAPSWIAQTIHCTSNSIIVVLDDEESVHGAWNTRFSPYLKSYRNFHLHHFKHGHDALDFIRRLTPYNKDRVVFLSDYELLRQDKDGIQVIAESQIKNATLVTSYYAEASVREKAIQLSVKVLPKQMASVIPIDIKVAGRNSSVNFFQWLFQKFEEKR